MAKSKKNLINNEDLLISEQFIPNEEQKVNEPVEAENETPIVKSFVQLTNKEEKTKEKPVQSKNTIKLGVNNNFSMSTTLLF